MNIELRSVPTLDPSLYKAGEDGFIYRTGWKRPTKTMFPSKLEGSVNSKGYKIISINQGGNFKTVCVHVLICSAFHGEKPEGKHCVRHLDGDGCNNKPSNLSWGTNKENEADKAIHGTRIHGSRHHLSKLTERQVISVLETAKLHGRVKAMIMHKDLGVTKCAIRDILCGKNWKHLIATRQSTGQKVGGLG